MKVIYITLLLKINEQEIPNVKDISETKEKFDFIKSKSHIQEIINNYFDGFKTNEEMARTNLKQILETNFKDDLNTKLLIEEITRVNLLPAAKPASPPKSPEKPASSLKPEAPATVPAEIATAKPKEPTKPASPPKLAKPKPAKSKPKPEPEPEPKPAPDKAHPLLYVVLGITGGLSLLLSIRNDILQNISF